jgi:hypothetical protein
MWKLIKIYFNSDEDSVQNGFQMVVLLESECSLKGPYFAHYNDMLGPRIEISLESPTLDDAQVENVVKQYPFVTKWTIEPRDPDPLSHAYSLAYSICKELRHLDRSKKIEELYKLFHWIHNMLGFSYTEEADYFINWSQRSRRGV